MARFVKEVGRNYNQFTPEDGPGSGTVTSVGMSVPTGLSISGTPITSSGVLALSYAAGYAIPTTIKQSNWDDAYTFVAGFPTQTGNAGRFLTTNGTTMSWANIAGTNVTGAALTETDDTNVTMTLGGTPATALLRSVSMTLGWAGQLAVSRGGTGAATLTGVLIGNGTSAVSAVVGGPNQILRRNSAGTAYEFFTASFLTNPMTLNFDMIYQAGGVPARLAGPTSTTKQFLTAVGDGTNTTSLAWGTIAATDISAAALTKIDDTNVTLTLGGTPATSLIRAVSLTLGWSGTLSAGRGGTGTSGVSGIMLGNLTAPVTGITGIGGQILRANPSTGVYEFWTPTYLQSPMTTAGDLITANAGGAPIRLAANTSADNLFLRTVSGSIGYAAIQGTDVVGAAITTANDTNITITASGNTTNALLRTMTLTAGWSGALSPARGGTGATTLTGVVIGSGIGTMVGVAGTANQLLRRNSANTAYEFWTATYMNNPFTTGGDLVVSNSAGAPLRLAGNTSTTRRYLSQIGDGTSVTSTSWEVISGGGGVSGSGTANRIPKWATSTSLTDSLIVDNGSTATVYGLFEVATSQAGTGVSLMYSTNTDTTAAVAHQSRFGTQSLGGGIGRTLLYAASNTTGVTRGELAILSENGGGLLANIGTSYATTDYALSLFNIAGTEAFRFATNGTSFMNGGNIGIGDSSPTVLVDAYKATGGIIRIRSGNGGAFYVSNSAKTNTIAAFGDAGGIIGGAADTTAMLYAGSVPLSFYVNSAERGQITTSGNVLFGSSGFYYDATNKRLGIGVATPSQALDISSAFGIAKIASSTGTNSTFFQFTNTGGSFFLGQEGSTGITFGATAYASVISVPANRNLEIFQGSFRAVQLLDTGQWKFNDYTSTASFPGTAAGYLAFTSSGDIITVAAPGGSSGYYRIDFNSAMPDTWSNMPSTLQFFDSSTAFITVAELSAFTQVRLLINKLGTSGATNSKIYLRYSTTYSQTASSYSAIGTSSVELAINQSNQFLETAWINLATGAKADVFIALVGDGGDGALDPVFGMIAAEFR